MLKPRPAPDAVGALPEVARRPVEPTEHDRLDAVVAIDRPPPLALGRAIPHEAVGVQYKRPFVGGCRAATLLHLQSLCNYDGGVELHAPKWPFIVKSPSNEHNVLWAKGLLKEAGLRSTAARVAVLQQLAALSKPASHADVVELLMNFGFDQSTIFRSLNELSDAGLVSRLDLGDQIRRFELRSASGDDSLEHPHFMCVDCGKVSCLNDFTFNLLPSRGPRREQLGQITEVLLKGHCGACTR